MKIMKHNINTKPSAAFSALAVGALCVGITAHAQQPVEGEKPKSLWERSASIGMTLTSGNSDTVLFTARAQAVRKSEKGEWDIGADGSYGENGGEKNNESAHGYVQYNHLFSERTFGYLRVDGLYDAIADIDYRVTLSPGIGYYLIKNERTFLSVEAGPGYVFEQVGGESDHYATLRFAEKFEHKFNDKTRIWQSLEVLPQVDDFDNFIVNAEVGVETALTEKSSLSVYAQNTYDNQPAPGREENDLKVVTAIVFKF